MKIFRNLKILLIKIIRTKDSLSLKFYAIKLYQDLIDFHLDDDEKDALIDVDLARLNFVRRNSVHHGKRQLIHFCNY